MKKETKNKLGLVIILIYITVPIIICNINPVSFGDSHVDAWGWANILFAIAIWELVIRDSFFKDK